MVCGYNHCQICWNTDFPCPYPQCWLQWQLCNGKTFFRQHWKEGRAVDTVMVNCDCEPIKCDKGSSWQVLSFSLHRTVAHVNIESNTWKNNQIWLQDSEWEVVDKPVQSSSPQVSRKDQTSSSSEGRHHTAPPSSLPSSPSKKKETSSTTPDGKAGSTLLTI